MPGTPAITVNGITLLKPKPSPIIVVPVPAVEPANYPARTFQRGKYNVTETATNITLCLNPVNEQDTNDVEPNKKISGVVVTNVKVPAVTTTHKKRQLVLGKHTVTDVTRFLIMEYELDLTQIMLLFKRLNIDVAQSSLQAQQSLCRNDKCAKPDIDGADAGELLKLIFV